MSDLFVCPRCHGVLERAGETSSCAACRVSYPSLGGIPCLVEDPPLWQALWKSRLDDTLATLDRRLIELAREAETPGLLERTRARIRHVRAAFDEDRKTLVELFADLVRPAHGGVPQLLPSADQRSGETALIQYRENLFRDYVWGRAETVSALDLVRRLASEPLAKTAVYGVGTGRLALDVQHALGAEQTLGFDVQPLPLLVAARMLRSEAVVLHEFPRAPHSGEATAVRQRLERPFPKPEGVRLAFADALRPPLAPGSLDTVITPWFIDAVPVDVRVTAAAVNRVLRPGGQWLNFGPLRFEGALSRTYAIDEVHELARGASFELCTHFDENVPYFHSPHSGNHRIERVFAFSARKTREAPALVPPPLFAPWLSDPRLPIPLSPAFPDLQKTSVLTVGILSMIDGRRSLADIAVALGQQWGIPPDVLAAELRPFLARLPFE